MMEEDKLLLWLTYQYVSYSTWRGASEENPEPPSRWHSGFQPLPEIMQH